MLWESKRRLKSWLRLISLLISSGTSLSTQMVTALSSLLQRWIKVSSVSWRRGTSWGTRARPRSLFDWWTSVESGWWNSPRRKNRRRTPNKQTPFCRSCKRCMMINLRRNRMKESVVRKRTRRRSETRRSLRFRTQRRRRRRTRSWRLRILKRSFSHQKKKRRRRAHLRLDFRISSGLKSLLGVFKRFQKMPPLRSGRWMRQLLDTFYQHQKILRPLSATRSDLASSSNLKWRYEIQRCPRRRRSQLRPSLLIHWEGSWRAILIWNK